MGPFTEIDLKELDKASQRDFKVNSQACLAFIDELRKRETKREAIEKKVLTLLEKAYKGELS